MESGYKIGFIKNFGVDRTLTPLGGQNLNILKKKLRGGQNLNLSEKL